MAALKSAFLVVKRALTRRLPNQQEESGWPDESDVTSGLSYGPNLEFTGTKSAVADYPSEDDVRSGVDFDSGGQTGNMTLPAVGDVETGEQFGTSGTEFTGTFDVPAEGDVEDGVGYGEDGTEFEGNVTLPAESNVVYPIQYGENGTEFTGSFNTPVAASDTAEENLRTLLSSCSTFWTATGTANAAAALAFIGIGNETKTTGFRAVVGEDTAAATTSAGTGGASSGGTIDLMFVENIGSAETEEGAITTFKSQAAAIMQQLQFLEGPYLIIQRTTAQGPPMRGRLARGDASPDFEVKYDVEHGVDSI